MPRKAQGGEETRLGERFHCVLDRMSVFEMPEEEDKERSTWLGAAKKGSTRFGQREVWKIDHDAVGRYSDKVMAKIGIGEQEYQRRIYVGG